MKACRVIERATLLGLTMALDSYHFDVDFTPGDLRLLGQTMPLV